ncbi:methylmalonyl Co-A mutase-associated GTPase MeaB [Terrimonas ferruginea]|uniref:methylmalonyl Co-A mutase-associated GTPase MeaB n=1 Tax=Terrimonas ferruginea TaxID=249 RepID=UPI00040251C6|nr:methylmalonyl Co-A mutase-associated GTPase MeaB [Terrimonas ferruginea]
MASSFLQGIRAGDIRQLARAISLVENEAPGYEELLLSLPADSPTKVVGLTGPPGAGKSSLTDALVGELIQRKKRVAVLCVDPSSPFNLGAVLGDRIRMNQWYTHPDVYIRSLATRGAMGGLNPKIIEITDVLKAAAYDYIIIETVGVGQSEIEIAGLADVTVVVVVPEAGDEIQTMKAGLMEIAQIFAVNKSDRPGADAFVKNLRLMLAPAFSRTQIEIPVIKTVATGASRASATGHSEASAIAHSAPEALEGLEGPEVNGIAKLWNAIDHYLSLHLPNERKNWLLAEKAYHLIQASRMKDISITDLQKKIAAETGRSQNLYQLIQPFVNKSR